MTPRRKRPSQPFEFRAKRGLLHQSVRAIVRPSVPHALSRWAQAVVSAVESDIDPRTVQLWGRAIGASPGALRNWCRTAGLSPRRSLTFARMLRVVVRTPVELSAPENLIDVADYRTLQKLLTLGNQQAHSRSIPTTIQGYLVAQRWITGPEALRQVIAKIVGQRYYDPRLHGSFGPVGLLSGLPEGHHSTPRQELAPAMP
jgi:hypothetical protein